MRAWYEGTALKCEWDGDRTLYLVLVGSKTGQLNEAATSVVQDVIAGRRRAGSVMYELEHGKYANSPEEADDGSGPRTRTGPASLKRY